MPVKKMTPEVCSPTDAGTKSRHILAHNRRMLKAFRNAFLKGTFIASAVVMFWSVMSIETLVWKSLILFLPAAAYFLIFAVANEGGWIFK